MSITAKSVVIDITDNHGDATYLGVRSIDFYLGGVLAVITAANAAFYATSYYNPSLAPGNAFVTSLSKTGSHISTSWMAAPGATNNVRLIIIFNIPLEFDEIVINNFHISGTTLTAGLQTVIITSSTDAITNPNYGAAISNPTEIYAGDIPQHIAADAADGFNVPFTTPTTNVVAEPFIGTSELSAAVAINHLIAAAPFAGTSDLSAEIITGYLIVAKSVIIDIADNYGQLNQLGLRSVEFYLAGELVEVSASNAVFYETTAETDRGAEKCFTTGLSKTGIHLWQSYTSVGVNADIEQRAIVVFDSAITFDSIVINNWHDSGGYTNSGSKTVEIKSSTDAITDTTYGAAITNGTLLYAGDIPEHIPYDSIDDFYVSLVGGIIDYVNVPAFSSTSAISAGNGFGLSVPAFSASSSLSVGLLIPVVIPPFESSAGLAALADIGYFVEAPAFESVSDLSANVSLFLHVAEFDSVGTISATPTRCITISAFEQTGEITASEPVIFSYTNPSILFVFILTGAGDGLDDIQIPITTIQARHRTGKPSYLSVTIPGDSYNAAIAARTNGELVLRMAKAHQGAIYHSEEIIRVDLEEIRPDTGAKNKSLTLTGHSTTTYSGKAVTLSGATYMTGASGKRRFRLAQPDIFVRPGDTVTVEGEAIVADSISYTIGYKEQVMELAE